MMNITLSSRLSLGAEVELSVRRSSSRSVTYNPLRPGRDRGASLATEVTIEKRAVAISQSPLIVFALFSVM